MIVVLAEINFTARPKICRPIESAIHPGTLNICVSVQLEIYMVKLAKGTVWHLVLHDQPNDFYSFDSDPLLHCSRSGGEFGHVEATLLVSSEKERLLKEVAVLLAEAQVVVCC
jgi:hypothetical protein